MHAMPCSVGHGDLVWRMHLVVNALTVHACPDVSTITRTGGDGSIRF